MADAKLNSYEAMFLLGPVAQTSNDHGIGLCKAVIERHGGKITMVKKWDERKLAYEIKRQKRGTYIVAYFQAPGAAIAPLEREVKLSDDFLRIMVTTADHLNETEMAAVEPQPIIKEERKEPLYDRNWNERPERSERGDRGGDRGGDRPRGRRDEFTPDFAE